ncbi:MAG: M48 family metallopeptidase [Elusimicrobiota bacterium]
MQLFGAGRQRTARLVEEVRRFLTDLRGGLPGLFPRPGEGFGPVTRPAGRARPRHATERRRAASVLASRVEDWSRVMGVGYGKVRVKDQRTRWGSCSAKGNLNFNWRLTLAPPEVLDYVVVHELAHLLEMSHSRDFWRLVERWCPDHKAHRRWLRTRGRGLLSEGTA